MPQEKELSHQTIHVQGMHCASCEILIEKYALSQKGIVSAKATLQDSKIEISYKDGKGINLKNINSEFFGMGYTFSHKPKVKRELPLFSIRNGTLRVNKEKSKGTFKVLLAVLVVIALFIVMDKLQLAKYINVTNNSTLPAYFLLGIIAGISSCAALVGGMLLSMTKRWNEIYVGEDEKKRSTPHVLFHIGRIVSFTVLGGVLGLIGKAFSFNNTTISAILVIVVSLFMLVLALQMLDVQWTQKIRFTFPKSFFRNVTNEQQFSGQFMPFLIGAATFFLPCGFTLIAQSVALTTGSFLRGGFIMLFFALGTLPTLVGISVSGIKLNNKPKNTILFNQIAGILILFFVFYNINSQLNVLGLPSLNDVQTPVKQEQTKDEGPTGTQTLNITAKGFSYIPTSSTTLKAGVETTLIIDNQGIEGCGTYMIGRGLFNGYQKLKPGRNEIIFTPKTGTYKITCSMGMVNPVIIIVK